MVDHVLAMGRGGIAMRIILHTSTYRRVPLGDCFGKPDWYIIRQTSMGMKFPSEPLACKWTQTGAHTVNLYVCTRHAESPCSHLNRV